MVMLEKKSSSETPGISQDIYGMEIGKLYQLKVSYRRRLNTYEPSIRISIDEESYNYIITSNDWVTQSIFFNANNNIGTIKIENTTSFTTNYPSIIIR